jgi:hypothetical protein
MVNLGNLIVDFIWETEKQAIELRKADAMWKERQEMIDKIKASMRVPKDLLNGTK